MAALDTRYHGVEEGQGLEGQGQLLTWVMGAWQEGSKDVHDLLEILADNKVAVLGLARGGKPQTMRGLRYSLVIVAQFLQR